MATNIPYLQNSGDLKINKQSYVSNAAGETLALRTTTKAVEMEDGTLLDNSIQGMVKYIPQTLGADEQAQARENIGALAPAEAILTTGGTLTGPLILARDAQSGKEAVTLDQLNKISTEGGLGDMLTTVYDPQGKKQDVFAAIDAAKAEMAGALATFQTNINEQITGIGTNATEISSIKETIKSLSAKITEIETSIQTLNSTITTHTGAVNPHNITKELVELGKVVNKKLTMTVSSDGKTLTTTYN
jgi:hypothetical protein